MRALIAGLVTLSLACASARPDRRAAVTPDELLAGGPLLAGAAPEPIDDAEVLKVSPEMQAFVERHVARGADAEPRLRQLTMAIIDQASFGLTYDETTRTAARTFRERRGNCLSFSSMFVALARHAGLKASYQEVDIPPDWSLNKDALVLNRHVNVVVELGRSPRTRAGLGSLIGRPAEENVHVVDFNMDDFRTTYDRRRISDERALAHFYNNVAVERMQEGDTAPAFLYFRRAVERDPTFAPAWTNMGTLYRRGGAMSHAEAAYLQALSADRRDLVAMSNLVTLYEQVGDRELAERYRRRVAEHRNSNPYYRFHLGREAIRARDYEAAIGHLRYAIRHKKNEAQFYFFLGLAYLAKGQEPTARRWFTRAEEVATSDAARRRYASKMELLLSGSRPD